MGLKDFSVLLTIETGQAGIKLLTLAYILTFFFKVGDQAR